MSFDYSTSTPHEAIASADLGPWLLLDTEVPFAHLDGLASCLGKISPRRRVGVVQAAGRVLGSLEGALSTLLGDLQRIDSRDKWAFP